MFFFFTFFSEFRDYCSSSRDCREDAYVCNRNFCECAVGYKVDDKNKTCVGGKFTFFFYFDFKFIIKILILNIHSFKI